MQDFSNFRNPSILTASPSSGDTTLDPKQINYLGDWFLIRTSNSFWKDKSDVRMHYTATGEDHFAYKPARSTVEKSMEGRNTPAPNSPATYSWAGKGLLRLFTVRWEILGFEEGTEKVGWLLTFQHKTMFTAPAVNIACRTKDGPNGGIVKAIEQWLRALGDEGLTKAVEDIYMIEHSPGSTS
ncbi:uncharacterized protein K441DRAFT_671445 [Cenococcum geophilum 1.58]|uniref:Uncharacterized protein n=1 Tax=Cenococcum geophilum 1.58 TaxID=794803 RepID=A0ACC8ELD0_9PEZI|nr:hypothetical protein K441DRAFT_671445 [Cenococcum geophilum 1.58]